MSILRIKKESARLNKKRYLESNLILLILIIPGIILTALPFALNLIDKELNIRPEIMIIASFVITLIFFIFNSAYRFGENSWYSGKMIKSQLGIKRLFFWLKPSYSIKAFMLKFLLFLIKSSVITAFILPSIIVFGINLILAFTGGIEFRIFVSLLIGGSFLLISGLMFAFIVNQRYFLAEYLYINNPKLKLIQVIKRSKNLSEGHILKVVKFKLSFIPEMLMCLLIIPIFFIRPYYKQSCCIVAKELCL